MSDTKDEASHDGILREMFSHYRDQTMRRWQYFSTILILQGIAASNWKAIDHDLILAGVGAGIAITTICLLMLISRIRYTIQYTAKWINALARAELLHTGPAGRCSLLGVTLWVYLPMIFVLLFWIAILFVHPNSGVFSRSMGVALILASIPIAFSVNWAVPVCKKPLILNGRLLSHDFSTRAINEEVRTNTCPGVPDRPVRDEDVTGGNPVM